MSSGVPTVSTQLPRPGDTIAGKYVLDRLLGQGGMGAVYAARHVKLSKAVAIKIMLADASNQEAGHRFVNEGRMAANINDDHVVKVDDVGEELGYAYMVLELLEGEDLSQLLARQADHRLPSPLAVHYVLQALSGVAQAHAIGIVHRDLKPSNLFLARRKDGAIMVKVLDFGISKAQGSSALNASPNALTSTKAMLGSPLYMSPEQLRSSKSVDHRADIWAMGVILYELLTGALPFMGENLGELFAAILENDPVPVRQHTPNVHPRLEEIVLRCLQRRPEGRFASAQELYAALVPFASGQGVAETAHMPGGIGSSRDLIGLGNMHLAGSNPHVAGTVPLGAVTPQHGTPQQGMLQTSSAWQSTGSGRMALPTRSRVVPLIIGIGAALFVGLASVAAVLYFPPAPPTTTTNPNASTAAATAPPTVVVPAVATTPAIVPPPDPAPPPSSVVSAQPSATVATPATKPTHRPKIDPPKPPDPLPTKPKPSAAPTNTGGGLQNTR